MPIPWDFWIQPHCRVGVWCLSLEYCTYIYTYTYIPCYNSRFLTASFIPPDWSVGSSLCFWAFYFFFFSFPFSRTAFPRFSIENGWNKMCSIRYDCIGASPHTHELRSVSRYRSYSEHERHVFIEVFAHYRTGYTHYSRTGLATALEYIRTECRRTISPQVCAPPRRHQANESSW